MLLFKTMLEMTEKELHEQIELGPVENIRNMVGKWFGEINLFSHKQEVSVFSKTNKNKITPQTCLC